MSEVALGTGTTITFATSGFTADILEYRFSRITRKAVDTTHFRTTQAGAGQFGGRTFMPVKLVDPGYLTLTVAFNPQRPPPIMAPPETITLTYPPAHWVEAAPNPWSFTGFLTEWRMQFPLDDKMTASIEIKITGLVQLVPIEGEDEVLLSAEPFEMTIAPPTTLYSAEPFEAETLDPAPSTLLSTEDFEA